MSNPVGALRQAYRLFRSDSRVETVVAAVIAAVVLGPPLRALWRAHREQ